MAEKLKPAQSEPKPETEDKPEPQDDKPTYDQLLEENARLKESGNYDLSWYNARFKEKDKEIELLTSKVRSLEEKAHWEKVERAQKEADQKAQEERELLPFQTPHTRFRLRERPTVRDIFGDTVHSVFDLGVELDNYTGPVQVPLPVVIEIAQSIGMLTEDQAKSLKLDFEHEKAKNEEAANAGTELINGISDLVDNFNRRLESVPRPTVVGDVEKDSGGSAEGKAASSPSGQTDKSSGSEGSDRVSDDSANSGPDLAGLESFLRKSK